MPPEGPVRIRISQDLVEPARESHRLVTEEGVGGIISRFSSMGDRLLSYREGSGTMAIVDHPPEAKGKIPKWTDIIKVIKVKGRIILTNNLDIKTSNAITDSVTGIFVIVIIKNKIILDVKVGEEIPNLDRQILTLASSRTPEETITNPDVTT